MPYILFAFTLPWSITVGWGWVGLMILIGAAHKPRWEPTLMLTAQWRPWVENLWEYTTTLGRGIIYQAGARDDARIRAHEAVHVRQVEDMMLLSLFVGLAVGYWSEDWPMALCIWWSGGLWQLPNFLTALLRRGDAYLDSEHERSAYAQTDLQAGGKSWLEKRDSV